MADFEIYAPDEATMMAAAEAITGLTRPATTDPTTGAVITPTMLVTGGVNADGIGWALNFYGKKFAPSGNKITVDSPSGSREVDELVAQPGVYAILRWNGDVALMPAVPAGAPITISPMPDNSPIKFA